MRYSILLADADGTLFDFHAGERKALTVTMNTLGMAVNDDLVALYSRVNLSHWLRLERGETTQARLRVERFADYWRELRALGVVVPDVPHENVSELFVEALSAQRIPMPGAEALLKSSLLKQLDALGSQQVMLKLTIPTVDDFYADLVSHPKVLRVVALSGGYSRDEANALLARNRGVIASFSRALTEGLTAQQSDQEFNKALDASIASIYAASVK